MNKKWFYSNLEIVNTHADLKLIFIFHSEKHKSWVDLRNFLSENNYVLKHGNMYFEYRRFEYIVFENLGMYLVCFTAKKAEPTKDIKILDLNVKEDSIEWNT